MGVMEVMEVVRRVCDSVCMFVLKLLLLRCEKIGLGTRLVRSRGAKGTTIWNGQFGYMYEFGVGDGSDIMSCVCHTYTDG